MNIFKKLENLERQLVNLASRSTTAKAESANAKAVNAQNRAEALDAELADMFLALVEMIPGGEDDE